MPNTRKRCKKGEVLNRITRECEPKTEKEKKKYCPRGERVNPVTGKCEPYTRKLRIKNTNTILPEIVTAIHPANVSVNTPNPLLNALFLNKPNETQQMPLSKTDEEPLPEKEPVQEPIPEEEPETIIKKGKLLLNPKLKSTNVMSDNEFLNYLNRLKNMDESERQIFLKSLKGDDLRNIWGSFLGKPRPVKTSGNLIKNDLIDAINININNEKIPDQPKPTAELISKDVQPEVQPETVDEFALQPIEQDVVNEDFSEEIRELSKEKEKEKTLEPINDYEEQLAKQLEKLEESYDNTDVLNKQLDNMELAEYNASKTTQDEQDAYSFLYPTLNDPNFNVKIAKRKEFNDTKYDGKITDIKSQAELLCNQDFEIMPNQLFVRNFLSFQTPYNSLLLFNGLGTGKTCSAIGVAEEMRNYLKKIGVIRKIFIIASPNVQANFRMQLFDERKLKSVNGLWTLDTCVGNTLLKEINPTYLKGIEKKRIIQEINILINANYKFMGITEFANFIEKNTSVSESSGFSMEERNSIESKKLKRFFNNRLVIIDEVHNLSITETNKNKRTALLLLKAAKHADNMRLLLLSATPMFNSYREIIWLVNLMNINDKRSKIEERDIFDKEGNFIEGGRELLERKLIGYISYVRGENPYTFPYRIYPTDFSPENTLKMENYPKYQMNGAEITDPMKYIQVYMTKIGEYQERGYRFIIDYLRYRSNSVATMESGEKYLPSFDNMEAFGYTLLQAPIESLNIVYPNSDLDANFNKPVNEVMTKIVSEEVKEVIANMIGRRGLANIMNYKTANSPNPLRYNYEYKPEVLEKYGRIFHKDQIHKYSSKIAKICECIRNSKGIVLVYSQYIDGGSVPIALALEEMGFTRTGAASFTKPLFKKTSVEPLDAVTMKPKSEVHLDEFNPASYLMITGDKYYSPDNSQDIKLLIDKDNANGKLVKVVLISRAAAEGLDFKNIRQVHILEPWYNMNRMEQIIGRGVRNFSHCYLPFEERNVEIYLHATEPLKKVISSTNVGEPEPSIMSSLSSILPQIQEPEPVIQSSVEEQEEQEGEESKKESIIIVKGGKQTGRSEELEETADLYVYRYAEKKAIQIGNVTRVLKEVSVDCVLNIGQTNFTVDKLLTVVENQNLKINLGSNKTIEFKIGDKPFTEICDYMDNCSYKCSPASSEINPETDIIRDTYNIDFIKSNYQMIAKRIRQLFKERTVYDKEDLISQINIIKEYPREQILFALSNFIENKEEYLLDKYNRRGYLINRENFFAFQPVEMSDENASVFERSVPIDFKRESIFLEMPKKTVAEHVVQTKPHDTIVREPETNVETNVAMEEHKYEEIIADINGAMTRALLGSDKSEVDWYRNVNSVIYILKQMHQMSDDNINKHVLYHYLDCLTPSLRMVLVNNIYSNDFILKREIEKQIKKYFDEKIIKSTGGEQGIVLLNNEGKYIVYSQSKDDSKVWTEATITTQERFRTDIIDKFVVKHYRFNTIIGFMSYFKDTNEMVFKIKDLSLKRNNAGANCDKQTKAEVIKRINGIIGKTTYTVENTENILKGGTCVILEILMRQFNDTNYGDLNKEWFFDVEKALVNRISACKLDAQGKMICI